MEIYIYEGNVQKGPFELQQIQSLAASGKVSREALYWQPGMDEWKPLAALKVFVPPPPIIPKPPTFEEEYNAPLYKTAYYQQRVIICFSITIILTGVVMALGQPMNTFAIVCAFAVSPFAIYGYYCFVRYQAALYGWFWSIVACTIIAFVPFLIIFRLAMSTSYFRKQYEEHDLEMDWIGNLKPKI